MQATATPGLRRSSRRSACAKSCARFRGRRTRGSSERNTARARSGSGLVPQGTLAERIRAAGAGIGAFYTPTAYGTRLAEGKETRRIGERDYVLEYPIHADYALIKADRADRWGNLTYRKSARNFGPIMAAAAKTAVAQVREIVELGSLDPETIVTPSIFVQRVVRVAPAIMKAA